MTMRRIIRYWLDRPPRTEIDLSQCKYLLFDGTYLKKRHTAIVGIADPIHRSIVIGCYGLKEGERRMVAFCEQLAQEGLQPISVTIDGLKQVQTMLVATWPSVIVQRCLVHIQRQGLSWCRRDPHTAAVKHLRRLFDHVTRIKSITDRDHFLDAWNTWEERFGQPIAIRPSRGKVFSDVKRARSLLRYALPHMFWYLEDPNIPYSTNWLEGYFSRLKSRYRQHRGLSPDHCANYFKWYFELCKT
jgi:transposase-like protein